MISVSDVRPSTGKRAKHPMVSASVTVPDTTRVIFQSIFKVPKKTAFCEVRNDLGGSHIFIYLNAQK